MRRVGSEAVLPEFRDYLKRQGYYVDDILKDIKCEDDTIPVLRRVTGLPNTTIVGGLFNEARDITSPRINTAIATVMKPWTATKTDEGLPVLSVKELSRMTDLSPEKVTGVLEQYPYTIAVNGSTFVTDVQRPVFPKGKLSLTESKNYGLSPSRVARAARYESRPPGGGPVQKAGLQDQLVDKVLRKKAMEELEVVLKPVRSEELVDLGVMEDLEYQKATKSKTIDEIIYAEPEGDKIMDVFNWFKNVGFGKNWVYQENTVSFAESLVKLSRGEPVDFVLWNCIGFKWFADPKGDMPTCNITNNLDAAITPFFAKRIQEMAFVLAKIGDPQLSILVPSNEACDERVWRYRETDEYRNQIIDGAVEGLENFFDGIELPDNATLQVTRWDDFLATRDAEKTPQEYSQVGEMRVRNASNFGKIVQEAVKSGRGYFTQNGITNIPDEIFEQRQIMYYGVYAGEGVVFEELQNRGRDIVVVNFEEMRVPQMAFLGSGGTTPVVTPINAQEMTSYYRWEARQVQKRL